MLPISMFCSLETVILHDRCYMTITSALIFYIFLLLHRELLKCAETRKVLVFTLRLLCVTLRYKVVFSHRLPIPPFFYIFATS